MDLSITANLRVLACELAVDQNGVAKATKDGKPLFQLLVSQIKKIKVGSKEIDSTDTFTLNSEIEIKASEKTIMVRLEQYAIADKNGRVNLYYRIKSLI